MAWSLTRRANPREMLVNNTLWSRAAALQQDLRSRARASLRQPLPRHRQLKSELGFRPGRKGSPSRRDGIVRINHIFALRVCRDITDSVGVALVETRARSQDFEPLVVLHARYSGNTIATSCTATQPRLPLAPQTKSACRLTFVLVIDGD